MHIKISLCRVKGAAQHVLICSSSEKPSKKRISAPRHLAYEKSIQHKNQCSAPAQLYQRMQKHSHTALIIRNESSLMTKSHIQLKPKAYFQSSGQKKKKSQTVQDLKPLCYTMTHKRHTKIIQLIHVQFWTFYSSYVFIAVCLSLFFRIWHQCHLFKGRKDRCLGILDEMNKEKSLGYNTFCADSNESGSAERKITVLILRFFLKILSSSLKPDNSWKCT